MAYGHNSLKLVARGLICLLAAVFCFVVGPVCALAKGSQADCCGDIPLRGRLQQQTLSCEAPCCAIQNKPDTTSALSGQQIQTGTVEPVTFESTQLVCLGASRQILAEEKSAFANSFVSNQRERYLRLQILLN